MASGTFTSESVSTATFTTMPPSAMYMLTTSASNLPLYSGLALDKMHHVAHSALECHKSYGHSKDLGFPCIEQGSLDGLEKIPAFLAFGDLFIKIRKSLIGGGLLLPEFWEFSVIMSLRSLLLNKSHFVFHPISSRRSSPLKCKEWVRKLLCLPK
eukprot:scaffold31886_cov66-Attheya_sp.AAC.6